VVLTQIPFVVIDVALIVIAIHAVIPHITPVVINVALIVIAIHAVMVKVLLQALTIASIFPTIGELSLVSRDIAVICISIPAILVQVPAVVIDVALILIAVVAVLVQIAPVRLLIRRFRTGGLRGCARHKHACQCSCSKTMPDYGFDFHADPPYFDPGFFTYGWLNTQCRKKFWPIQTESVLQQQWVTREHYGSNIARSCLGSIRPYAPATETV
jgi:hypothetical protein